MDEGAFLRRTKDLALRVLRLVDVLPKTDSGKVIGRQILRSATSVGANYRSVCRARSKADMAHKLGIVEEELDETLFWLELLGESGLVPVPKLQDLMSETQEILAMVVASRRTLSRSLESAKIENRKSKIENHP